MAGEPPTLSVVIPAYNEERRLPETLAQVWEYLESQGRPYELVLVDDGSSDQTLSVMRSTANGHASVKVVSLPANRGKGRAVAEGVAASTGELVLFTDADMSTPIEEVAKLEAALDRGADVAVASRGLRESEIVIPQPGMRVLMGKVFNLIVQGSLLVPRVWDTQCGFKLFRGAAGRQLFGDLRTDGFAFDVEVLHNARRRGLRIAEVPVRWSHSAPTKVRWSHPVQMFWDVLKIRLRG
ncbi:MAG TPA: dolichyl-phosphate beta-glucosyltransferase [Candidatus Dormibacteraeota bacterium]